MDKPVGVLKEEKDSTNEKIKLLNSKELT